MRQNQIRTVLMRGGTSKCAMYHDSQLPAGTDRDRALLSIFGSPDPRQINGIGGAVSSTSKACLISPSDRQGIDVDYTFAQVSVSEPIVDYKGNCGNCSAAVGPFAIEEGMVSPQEGMTTVRILNTNTDKLITAEVPVTNGKVIYNGDFEIAGVPGKGAAQRLWFNDPKGSVSGKLLPTGKPADTLNIGGESISVTLVDAANPVVFVSAEDMGLTATESPEQINNPKILEKLETIRGNAAVWLGLAGHPEDAKSASPAVPKVSVIGAPMGYQDIYGRHVDEENIGLVGRMLSLGKCHTAYPVTGAVATSAAAEIPGTVVHSKRRSNNGNLRIGHPSGVIPVDMETTDFQSNNFRTGVYRTARKIFDGTVYF